MILLPETKDSESSSAVFSVRYCLFLYFHLHCWTSIEDKLKHSNSIQYFS